MTQLDKNLYREAYQEYQRWNDDEVVARARGAGKLSPLEAWKQYVGLFELCRRLTPQQSSRQSAQRMEDWRQYYTRIQQFEARRQALGNRS